MAEKIVGSVERIVYCNKENGYHVLNVLLNGKNEYSTVTTNQLKIHEGSTMEFEGQWVLNKKFGNQFKADKATEVSPETKEAMVKYLSSNFFKGIGPVIARKIVKHFGDKTFDILKEDIDKLINVQGISKKKLEKIKDAWIENSEINDIMVFLQSYNISTLFATKIYEFYGKSCVSKIKENPYSLAYDIKGIGFKYADNIAMDMGFAKDSEERISAAIIYILEEGINDGHCYLLHNQVINKTNELLGVKLQEKISIVLSNLVDSNIIKLSSILEDKRYYSLRIYYDEKYVSDKIKKLKEQVVIVNDEIIKDWECEVDKGVISLSEEQINSIKKIVYDGVSILTGGPGVGKTTVLKFLVKLLKMFEYSICLAAPTGRAARRMCEATGYEAQTIHRVLEWDFANGGFKFNEKNQIDYNFVIIDESSMVDINLAASLLKAIPVDCQILFVGDVDQLPPVGPGLFLKDLIKSKIIPTYNLTKIYRQGKGSEIIEYAHQINEGIEPIIESPILNPSIWGNVDCMFIDSGFKDNGESRFQYPYWSSLYYGLDVIEMVKKLYTESIEKYYGDKTEIQVLIPMNIGNAGTNVVNTYLQEKINPSNPSKPEIKIGERYFRVSDRVIQTVNNYDLDGNSVMNGEIGKIIGINPEEKEMIVEFDDDKKVLYKRDNLLEIKLAYAISIHKAQGSQFDTIIFPILNDYSIMLYKQLVYTGLTRSKRLCIFVGERSSLFKAVKNTKPIIRQTSLSELLQN